MTVAARRQRVSPTGPFIINEEDGSGPLEVGDGTQGLVLRQSGVEGAAPIAMTGAVVLIDQWRDRVDPNLAIDTIPWLLEQHSAYDIQIDMPMQLPVAPAGNVTISLTAFNLTTLARVTLLTMTRALPDTNFYFQAQLRDAYAKFVTASYNALQVEVTAPATCTVHADLMAILITQYQT